MPNGRNSDVFVISTRADGPWNRADTKHQMRELLTMPRQAQAFSPYLTPSANSYLPMSRAVGDFEHHRPRVRAETTYGQRGSVQEKPDHTLNPYRLLRDDLALFALAKDL